MNDHRFEQLVLVLGAAAVLGSLALSYSQTAPDLVEIVAQLMVFVVLFAALKGGRRAGQFFAVAATALYVLLRLPAFDLPLDARTIVVLVTRIGAYGLVGIVGGEIFGRMRYVFAGMERASAIDEWSHVYNQSHARSSLERAIGRFERYGEDFSAVLVTLSGSIFSGMAATRHRSIVRTVADMVREDVRLVDEVARLDDGRFLVLLPHTPRAGAQVVSSRLQQVIAKTLGARSEAVAMQVLGTPSDASALKSLADALAVGETGQSASGRYSDEASSTRNPAA